LLGDRDFVVEGACHQEHLAIGPLRHRAGRASTLAGLEGELAHGQSDGACSARGAGGHLLAKPGRRVQEERRPSGQR
jgi:hypothetical protein